MGNACCSAAAGDGATELVRHDPERQRVQPTAAASDGAVTQPGGGGSGGAAAAASSCSTTGVSPHLYFDSTADSVYSDAEEEWHDAMSEVDLAEALEAWEDQQHVHVAEVDRAIQVMKAKGHLLPPRLEALASEQREEEMAAGQQHLRLAAGVAAHAAEQRPVHLALERTRSQQLHVALEQPAAAALLQQAAGLAAEGKVLAAHATLLQLGEACGGSLAELASLTPGALTAALAPGASLDVDRVVVDAQHAQATLEALEDNSGWMVSREDGLRVYYRHHRGTTQHSMKFRTVVDHPLEHLLAIAHEFDLVVTWNKFSLDSLKLASPTSFESYIYGAQWMMKPFKHMQAMMRARAFDLADEHRCLLVTLIDCAPEELPAGHAPLPKEWPKRKLINCLPGSCLVLRPLAAAPDGTPRTEGSIMMHIDPHIPFIPAFLLNFVLGVLAPYIFNQIVKVLDSSFADPEGVYSSRIRDQPHVYGLVRRRLAQFQNELRPQAAAAAQAVPAADVGKRKHAQST